MTSKSNQLMTFPELIEYSDVLASTVCKLSKEDNHLGDEVMKVFKAK